MDVCKKNGKAVPRNLHIFYFKERKDRRDLSRGHLRQSRGVQNLGSPRRVLSDCSTLKRKSKAPKSTSRVVPLYSFTNRVLSFENVYCSQQLHAIRLQLVPSSFFHKICDIVWFFFHVLHLSADQIYTTKLVLLQQIYDENICKSTDRESDLPGGCYGYRKCLFVEVCYWILRSSQLCSLVSEEQLIIFEDVV